MDHSGFKEEHTAVDTLGTTYRHGEVIFREGDMDNSLYIVQTGKVRLHKTIPSGMQVEVALLGPGEAFGIASLADDKILPRYATATAEGRTSILQIDRARLIKAIYDDATLIFSIFKAMSRRARNLTDRLANCQTCCKEEGAESVE